MENHSFPELGLTAKRSIFWLLIMAFASYSYLVYNAGTEYDRGKSFYSESAKDGKLVFQEYNCIACHQIYGLGGYMGPDLTNVMTAPGKGRPFAEAFIRSGTAKMPRFDMSDSALVHLLDYLQYVGEAGNYPVTDAQPTWYGNINLKTDADE